VFQDRVPKTKELAEDNLVWKDRHADGTVFVKAGYEKVRMGEYTAYTNNHNTAEALRKIYHEYEQKRNNGTQEENRPAAQAAERYAG